MLSEEIDKLTKSIEEVATGKSFATEIELATAAEVRRLSGGWRFNWKQERLERDVYRLIAPNIGSTIQGLISLEQRDDHVFVHLIESHPLNIGRNKKHAGVAGNLMAFAAKLSIASGNEGYVAFDSKTELVDHYTRTLGAHRVGNSHRMVIHPKDARNLVEHYFGEQHGTNG